MGCCLLLSGCAVSPEGNGGAGSQALDSDQSVAILKSYEEYLEFCNDEDTLLPDNFVYYQKMAELGTFDMFIGYGLDEGGKISLRDYGSYHYRLKDEENRAFSIWGFGYVIESESEKTDNITPEDMRLSSDKDDYRVFVDEGLQYHYTADKLTQIAWEVNGASIVLKAEDGFSAFEPNSEGTFVERLLCLESAPAALEEFVEMVSIPDNP